MTLRFSEQSIESRSAAEKQEDFSGTPLVGGLCGICRRSQEHFSVKFPSCIHLPCLWKSSSGGLNRLIMNGSVQSESGCFAN